MINAAPLWQFVAILAVHWVADFVLQTHWQASNKSKNINALARHVGTYTFALCAGALVIFPDQHNGMEVILFTVANGILHFATDYFTSRFTAHYFGKQDWHNGFVVVGFDQLIHQATLALTMWVFFTHVNGVQ